MNKLIVIDGHAFAFRAYYAFQTAGLRNSLTGEPSGAVFGFFRMLFKVLNDFEFTHLALTFDPGTPLERNKIYSEYKANRKPMPEDLKPQIAKILSMSKNLGFPVLSIPGHEADDIIGTIAKNFSDSKTKVYIFSGDKDMYQLLENENILMLRGKKGVTEFDLIDKDRVKELIGVPYNQVTNYMGIVGDSSDNIPGVKGLGEKGAVSLFSEFKDLEDIYANLDKIKSKATKEKLITYKDNAFMSRELATIRTDLDLELKLEDLKLSDYLSERNVLYFKQEGFNALHRDLAKQAGVKASPEAPSALDIQNIETSKANYTRIKTLKDLETLVQKLSKSKKLCVDTETTSVDAMQADLLGIALSDAEGRAWYLAFEYGETNLFTEKLLPLKESIKLIKPLLEDEKIPKIGQNIKYDIMVLRNHGIELQNIAFDTMLASYSIQPEGRRHNMDDLALSHLNYKTISYSDLTGTGKNKRNLYEIDPEEVSRYSCEDADITYRLYKVLEPQLKEHSVTKIFSEIEMPLIPVLVDMESKGVKIDAEYFKKLSGNFQKEIIKLEKEIQQLAGKEFNIASTRELQQVLFEDLNLPKQKKTSTGYSTDHSVMEALLGMHPIVEHILNYRKYTKLKSTYVDSLPELINPKTGRIHTSFNQTIAATGRLSSTDPNLQNIPIKDKEGKMIRSGFIPEEGNYLLSLDYSQIELRIMAHFAEDKNMIEAYEKGLDIHSRTASALFSVPEDKVDSDMRSKAKAVNFSVIYGVTPFGLSRNIGISTKEAKEFIDKYFSAYPGVKAYMDKVCKEAETRGYVETLSGRRRYVPDLRSSNKQIQEAAKRVAINSPIQGTSADMIKLAMIAIHKEMKQKKYKSNLILQVHDELVFEANEKEKEKIYALAKKTMENIFSLKVPILVEGKSGRNWDEAH
ncbi:MAG: DNA polymerase I [Leptospiraceae bacterium]|nr:DNA polymerase I [Leptospiraceae bacterium]